MKQWVMRHGAFVGGVFLAACGPSTKDETTGEDLAALAESNGKVAGPSGAATKLGIPRSTLDRKILQLNINKHRFMPRP